MAKTTFISDTKAFDNYSKGWKIMLASFWILLLVIIISALIDSVSQIMGKLSPSGSILFGILWGIFLVGPIKIGVDWVFLKAAKCEKFQVSNMFDVFQNYGNAVVAGVLQSIFVILGLILLIIPGIIIMIRLAFVNYLIMDKKMKAWEAIKTSWQMTRGHSWTIFGMGLLAFLIAIAGLITFIVGILAAAVWISASFAVLYYSVLKKG